MFFGTKKGPFWDIPCENTQGFSNIPPWVRESQPIFFTRILLLN
jgi:hypothetical protein